MRSIIDAFYIVRTIATKDILDAIKNKSSRVNFLVMLAMIVFFYWLNFLRPFDKDVSVVVYDEGQSNLMIDKVSLGEGVNYSFRTADSLSEMETKMANQNLGLVLPADLDQTLASGGPLKLSGYIFWVDRGKKAELEAKYSQAFTEILGHPVNVVIADNIVIPDVDSDGFQTSAAHLMIYFIFTVALTLIPQLMLEEKQTKTLDALLTTPASAGQIVSGKALAGAFYLVLIGGVALALFSPVIVNWPLAIAALLGYILFAIVLSLAVGIFMKSMKQVGIYMLVLLLFLVIPPLFYMESNLKSGIRAFLTWFPSSALASLFRFSCSKGVTWEVVLPNLAIVIASVGLCFGLVVWKVQRSDRS